MLTNAQKSLLKQAQRAARIPDDEYRSALLHFTGCTTSTDPNLTDAQLDLLMAYFEAIYWRQVDFGVRQPSAALDSSPLHRPCKVFAQRGYWSSKNPKHNTSRDRFHRRTLADQILDLEAQMADAGYGPTYCQEILARVSGPSGRTSPLAYKVALQRTLKSKVK